jgi:serine/threonine protein kinase
MDTTQKPVLNKPVVRQPVMMPDGTEPLPLGSGTIKCLLGGGGAANVYKIFIPQLETYRAVKLLKPDSAKEWRRRFQTEMKIMAALSHPNIIEIHTVGMWNSLDFIEMELIEGSTLAELIKSTGALPVQVSTAIAVMVARALVHAHDQKYVLFGKMYHGIIHRDIKPSNIMVSKDGRIKLMDFGVARPITASLLTTTDGGVVGTIQYMAPEQLSGVDVDVTTDVYALGTILYEMLTGEMAFPHPNLSELFEAKTKNEFVPLHLFNIPISKRLKGLVNSCMAFEPAGRPQSASDLLDELESIFFSVSHESCETVLKNFRQSSGKDRTIHFARKRPLLPPALLGLVLGILCIAAVAVVMVTQKSRGRPGALPAPKSQFQPPVEPVNPGPRRIQPFTQEKAVPVRGEATKKNPPVTAASRKHRSYLDEAKSRLGISDPLEVLAKEAEDGDPAGVIRIFDDLPADVARDPSAQLFRLRALFALGKTTQAAEILNGESPINDGEFYLIKAKYACDRGNTDQAIQLLDKAAAVKARNLNAELLRRDCLFWRAVCLTRRFDAQATDANQRDALDGWFEVKNAMRKNTGHEYYRKAISEMQRIGDNQVQDK